MTPTPWDLPPRIAAKIAVDGDTGCWLWTASRTSDGYGQAVVGGAVVGSHRAVFEMLVGAIPEGLEADHLCTIRRCANPEHIQPVTQAENIRRAAAAIHARPIYPCGHPRTPENTHERTVGRWCLTCRREDDRLRKARTRAQARSAA